MLPLPNVPEFCSTYGAGWVPRSAECFPETLCVCSLVAASSWGHTVSAVERHHGCKALAAIGATGCPALVTNGSEWTGFAKESVFKSPIPSFFDFMEIGLS